MSDALCVRIGGIVTLLVLAGAARASDFIALKPYVFNPTTEAECQELGDRWSRYVEKKMIASNQCSQRILDMLMEAGALSDEYSRIERLYGTACVRESGWCVDTFCGVRAYYQFSGCRTEISDFECAMVERSEALRECRIEVREHEEKERQEEGRQREKEQERESRRRESGGHEPRSSVSERDREAAHREEKRGEWDRREEKHRERIMETALKNAERYGRAREFSQDASGLMGQAHAEIGSATSSVGGVILQSAGSIDLASSSQAVRMDISSANATLLDSLVGLSTPLASIPLRLAGNVFHANLRAADDLSRLIANFDTATIADADQVVSRHMRSSFGAINVMSVILGGPSEHMQSQIRGRFLGALRIPDELVDGWDLAQTAQQRYESFVKYAALVIAGVDNISIDLEYADYREYKLSIDALDAESDLGGTYLEALRHEKQ